MTEKRVWFTTAEISRRLGDHFIIDEMSLKKALEVINKERWLSSQAAGELANQLEESYLCFCGECRCCMQRKVMEKVVRVLREANK